MAESDGHFFDKPLLRKTPKKNVETVMSETEQHTFTKPELRSINNIKTSDGRSDKEGHTFEKPALRGASPRTLKNEEVLSGKFDKPTLRSLPGSLASTEKEKTDCTNYGFQKPALKPVEQPENKGMDLENNDSVKEGEENQRPSWMINLRRTGNQPVEDKEKPKSSEPEWSQAARNKTAKALQLILSKENQSQETEKPAAPWAESNMLRQSPKSYPYQETNTAEVNRLIPQTGQKGLLSNSSANDSEIDRGARSRRPCTGTGEKKKHIMQKILKTYPNKKVLVLLKANNCDADVVITPETDLGDSTSSSDDKDVVERLSVPVWNRGERKEKHRLYKEITRVLMGLCSKSWKSAGFCINPVGGWSFEHYFKCFLYEINNFYTGLSVKCSVECVFLFTNDAEFYRLASHIAENYFPYEVWSPAEDYKHLGTWQDCLKGEKKKQVMQKILRTYPHNKVVVLLKATNCDADVVIIPEIDLGDSISSSDDKDVVERLSVPVWNRGERKEKHRLYKEITRVLMGLCSKSWKSAGFCINPVGGWSFEHYFKCFLYEINNFYTGLSVKCSVECVFLFTNDAEFYRLASHIAENCFPDPYKVWAQAEDYKHLDTWQDYLKGRQKSTDMYLQTCRERAPCDSSRQPPSLFGSSDSRPIPGRVQGAFRMPWQYRQGSFEQPSFMRGLEREHRQSSRHIRSLSVPEENKFSSERVQQESMSQPSQINQEHPIQETTSLESEFPHYKMNARPRGICLIISNLEFKKEDLSTRHGTEIDLVKLQNMFSRLHFIVMVRENLDGPDMIRELVDISRRDHTHYDCFVCCILSHGTQDTVYGSDGIPVEIGRLTSMVQPIMCRTLGEKPKLFFIQACQGLQKDEGMEIEVDAGVYTGNMPLIPSNADFLLGYATVRGYVSFRVPDEGAWYISKLVEMLDKYHKCMDLLSILTKVNDEVSKMEVVIDGMRLKQMPSKYSTLRRKLVFK